MRAAGGGSKIAIVEKGVKLQVPVKSVCIPIDCVVSWGCMYKFSEVSESRLRGCHPDLVDLVMSVMAMQVMDFSVLCGYRDKDAQDDAVKRGCSRDPWPMSHHNAKPSLAVDLAAYPIDNFDEDNTRRTYLLAGLVLARAKEMGLPVYWGGDWKSFQDIYHFQLPRGYK